MQEQYINLKTAVDKSETFTCCIQLYKNASRMLIVRKKSEKEPNFVFKSVPYIF